MTKWRAVLGLVVGAFQLLSAFAHSVLGGRAMKAEIAKTNVPDDLASSLTLGWYLGGMAMLVFGGIVLWTFWRGLRGHEVSLVPPRLIGLGYLAFAALALALSGFEPFFAIVFGLPGLLLAVASFGRAFGPSSPRREPGP